MVNRNELRNVFKDRKRMQDPSFNPVKLEVKTSDGTLIRGKVNIGRWERLSEIFTQDDPDNIIPPFLVVFDASHIGSDEGTCEDLVFFINREHIIWVKPDDTPD